MFADQPSVMGVKEALAAHAHIEDISAQVRALVAHFHVFHQELGQHLLAVCGRGTRAKGGCMARVDHPLKEECE